MEEKQIIGELQEKTEKPYKNKEGTYLNVKIGNKYFNIFKTEDQEKINSMNYKEKIKVTFTEKQVGEKTFNNVIDISEVTTHGDIIEEQIIDETPEEKKEPAKEQYHKPTDNNSVQFWKDKFYDRIRGTVEQHMGKCNNEAIQIISALIISGRLSVEKPTEDKEQFREVFELYEALTKEIFRTDKKINKDLKTEIEEIIREKTR